jgi:hypothetical protein
LANSVVDDTIDWPDGLTADDAERLGATRDPTIAANEKRP